MHKRNIALARRLEATRRSAAYAASAMPVRRPDYTIYDLGRHGRHVLSEDGGRYLFPHLRVDSAQRTAQRVEAALDRERRRGWLRANPAFAGVLGEAKVALLQATEAIDRRIIRQAGGAA